MTQPVLPTSLLATALLVLLAGEPARAMDGAAFSSEPTYYEEVATEIAPSEFSSTATRLPSAVNLTDSSATATYSVVSDDGNRVGWNVAIRGLIRKHERIDVVYQMVLVLPLPVDGDGKSAFKASTWTLAPREGAPGASVPLMYGGEKVALKRNRSLERTLLPNLVGQPGVEGKGPSLEGPGYDYTLWDTIIRYDPEYGDTVQLFMDVGYSADAEIAPPDARDDRLKLYVVTWIPSLDPTVPPFALRIDVVDPE
jgi:hypothetical protein